MKVLYFIFSSLINCPIPIIILHAEDDAVVPFTLGKKVIIITIAFDKYLTNSYLFVDFRKRKMITTLGFDCG
ncbi:unnamed protein product [Schistosoma margrebowiei]|uniref:Uncharacterized protein n=1 Tax=Schistosoma margrebowiei TaxID=48269 RepID=A0A3P7Y1J7_9TREM|nr:unnamed protein product [Schistosoma margrebowiei]